MSLDVLIMGSGGHAEVVGATLLECDARIIAFVDVSPERVGARVLDVAVISEEEALRRFAGVDVVVANGVGSTGSVERRRHVHERCVAAGWRVATVMHPSATVSRFARLDAGVQVLAKAVVQPQAHLGEGAIVNTGAIVEHHCNVGAHTHLASGAVVAGGAEIGPECHVGANATIIQGIRLGPRTIVGAGAVVIDHHAGDATLIGVPAMARGR